MIKIFIDPGHGGKDPGAVGNGLVEKNLNLEIAHLIKQFLTDHYQDIVVQMSRTKDETISLRERTNQANKWGADLYLSIHINAGGGQGFESYIFSGQFANKNTTDQIRRAIHDMIIEEMNLNDRGKKEANFHVLRETRMPAVLTESGFIDHKEDARNLRNNDWLEEVAESHGKGIAKALNLTPKTESKLDDPFYRVVSGSFLEYDNARKKADQLKRYGYESYILPTTHQNDRYYRVIVGAFRQRNNAERRVSNLEKDGFDSFIVEV